MIINQYIYGRPLSCLVIRIYGPIYPFVVCTSVASGKKLVIDGRSISYRRVTYFYFIFLAAVMGNGMPS